jgi:prepilin-type N-terminal cleavage/methylation domain-containing protein
MQSVRHSQGFTLIELLVGLLVTSILLSAVATLAFAMTSANAASGDTAAKQVQLRQATLHICELVRPCRLLCAAPDNDVVVWRADDNGDNQINVNELVYIERGSGLDTLQLRRFSSASNPQITLGDLSLPTTKPQLISDGSGTCIPLIPQANDVQFRFDAAPPFTKRLVVTFGLTENGVVHSYEISVALRAWAGHLLTAAGDALVPADDD